MTQLLVANRVGGTIRQASKQETCHHVWVPTGASCGHEKFYRCINCSATCASAEKPS